MIRERVGADAQIERDAAGGVHRKPLCLSPAEMGHFVQKTTV
jgi:hypothetical protein